MAALTANEKFLLVRTTFDEPAKPNPDASLDEITSASIPYQSPQGLTGF
jgi:hypothetical protein